MNEIEPLQGLLLAYTYPVTITKRKLVKKIRGHTPLPTNMMMLLAFLSHDVII